MFLKIISISLFATAVVCIFALKSVARSYENTANVTATPITLNLLELDEKPSVAVVESVAMEENQEEILEEVLSGSLGEIAEHFSQKIQYPDFSMPIENQQALEKYLPNRGAVVAREVEQLTVTLQTTKFKYQKDETISGTVTASDRRQQTVQILLVSDQQTVWQENSYLEDGVVEFGIPSHQVSWPSGHGLVVATFSHGGETLTLSTPVEQLQVTSNTPEVSSAEKSYVDNQWLVIPINVQVSQPGYYRIEGNLYSVETDQALVHLVAEQSLESGAEVIELRAHIRALKVHGDEGDYRLADLLFERMPSEPDYETTTGISRLPELDVAGFSFQLYDDQPYLDLEAEARLEFLQGMN